MSKTIETIWKEGFVDKDALIAPKINDLYNQKSQNIVDKLQRMFEINIKAIFIAAIIIAIFFAFNNAPLFGLFIAGLLMSLVVLGKKQLKELAAMDKNVSSYQYIKSFDQWLKALINQYTQIYRFLYPLFFVSGIVRFAFTDVGLSIINGIARDFPSIPQVFGMPIVLPLVVAFIAFLLSYFAGAIYRLDMQSLYGRKFKKLREIINDMETLQN
jgi:hypothetical protein